MRRLAVLAAVLGIGGAMFAAVPAMASDCTSGCGVNATATVSQVVSITGLSPTVSFGTIVPGNTATVTGAENYTVATNDLNGYTLTITGTVDFCGSVGFYSGDSHCLPNYGALAIAETQAGTSIGESDWQPGVVTTAAPQTIDTTAINGSNTYSENWALQIPASEAAGTYTEAFTYTAVGN